MITSLMLFQLMQLMSNLLEDIELDNDIENVLLDLTFLRS